MVELTREQLIERGMEETEAANLLPHINRLLASLPAGECWQRISREVICPDHPFQLHKFLYETVYADWDASGGPAPAWFPSDTQVRGSNIAGLMDALALKSYGELHAWSTQNRGDFWATMVRELGIRFRQGFTDAMDLSAGAAAPKWLVDARLNIAVSCFNAPDDAPAIVYQQEGEALSTMTYGALDALTNRVANGLVDAGFRPGDAIAIDMPMTAESVGIYLGVVKAGCAAVSIADSFAPHEIETRLRLAGAKAIFTQDYIPRGGKLLPLYERVVSAGAPMAVVLPCGEDDPVPSVHLRDRDVAWEDFLSGRHQFDPVARNPSDRTNILFSSGTTGDPKTIPWTQTTPIKCAADGYLHQDIQPGDVVAWPTNLGWMMGPWLIYASLINGATMALYYGTPTGRGFGAFVQDAGVTVLGVVPSLVRAWRDTDCMRGLDWGSIKAFSSTGECSNFDDMLFLMSRAGYRPIIEYCGGTEIGGAYITGTTVQPAAPATFSTPALGLDLVILDENGRDADSGEVFLIPPSIGLSTEMLNRDHYEVYFEGTPEGPTGEAVPLRRHGDQIERLGGGYFRAHGRVDDTMNLGGIKVSSAEIERVLNSVAGVRETAAISVSPEGGGPSRLAVYAEVLPEANTTVEALTGSLQAAIREHLNPLFKVHDVVVIDSLPRTASNKVMRRVLREQYMGSE